MKRLRLCRQTVVAVLDVAAHLRSCGSAWRNWQFPTEQLIGTLTRLVLSRRFPNAALTTTESAKYSAELVTTCAETHAAEAWVEASGKPTGQDNRNPAGTFQFSDDPPVDHLPPRWLAEDLIGHELLRMKNAVDLEGATKIPRRIIAKKYFRMRLASGQIAASASSGDDAGDGRRDVFVRGCSHAWQAARSGRGVYQVPVNVFGAVHHCAVALIDGEAEVVAYLECIKSSADRHGSSGRPEKRLGTDCFKGIGGAMRFVSEKAIDAAVGTNVVRGNHVFLYTREEFSSDSETGYYIRR